LNPQKRELGSQLRWGKKKQSSTSPGLDFFNKAGILILGRERGEKNFVRVTNKLRGTRDDPSFQGCLLPGWEGREASLILQEKLGEWVLGKESWARIKYGRERNNFKP